MTAQRIGETYEESDQWLDLYQVCWQFEGMAVEALACCERIDMVTGYDRDEPSYYVRLQYGSGATTKGRYLGNRPCHLVGDWQRWFVVSVASFEEGRAFVDDPRMVESLIMEDRL